MSSNEYKKGFVHVYLFLFASGAGAGAGGDFFHITKRKELLSVSRN